MWKKVIFGCHEPGIITNPVPVSLDHIGPTYDNIEKVVTFLRIDTFQRGSCLVYSPLVNPYTKY